MTHAVFRKAFRPSGSVNTQPRREVLPLWGLASEGLEFPTVWRNLALVYCNIFHDLRRAQETMERTFSLDESGARVLAACFLRACEDAVEPAGVKYYNDQPPT